MIKYYKYYWNYNASTEDAEGGGDTIEDCLQAARKKDETNEKKHGFIFVAECKEYKPYLDGAHMLHIAEDQLWDEAGDATENWSVGVEVSIDDLEELGDKLTAILTEWLGMHGYRNPIALVNTRAYNLETGAMIK